MALNMRGPFRFRFVPRFGPVPDASPFQKTASATFVGVGLLAATAVRIVVASATLAGVGTLNATAVRVRTASVAFAGAGTLSATPAVKRSASASFGGIGTLAATSVKISGQKIIPGRSPSKRIAVPPESFQNPRVFIIAHYDASPNAEVAIRWPAPIGRARGRATSAHAGTVRAAMLLRGDASMRGRAEPPAVGTEDEDLLLLAALLFDD